MENWGNLIISSWCGSVSYGKISTDSYHLFRIGQLCSMKLVSLHLIRLLFGACLNKDFYLFFTTRRVSCCLFVKIWAFIERVSDQSLRSAVWTLDMKKQKKELFFREIQNSSRHGRNNSLYQFINWLRSWENPAFRNSIQSKRTAGQNMTKARVKYDWRFINFPTDCGLRHSWFSQEKEKL